MSTLPIGMGGVGGGAAAGGEFDNTGHHQGRREPLVLNMTTFGEVTRTVCRVTEAKRPPLAWYVAFAISTMLVGVLGVCVLYLIATGVGVWGLNNPVMWAFDITNFVFWIGIGHAGTLISAILFLFRQKWRTGINRFAEAMTIFAVMCAGIFPAIHVGPSGSSTGSSRSRTRWRCGRSSAAPSSGTCSR